MSDAELLAGELEGIEAVTTDAAAPRRFRRTWSSAWPKLAAVALMLAVWQLAVWCRLQPDHVLPGPGQVVERVWKELSFALTWRAIGTTMYRAMLGFAMAIAIGTTLGAAVARFQVLRIAVGSMITGLQTMPSIAWFPLALLLFDQSEAAITFVVVLGAAPSIANGLISGVDSIPPIYHRAGKVLGASGLARYQYVLLPAALPSFVAGLKQGWVFVWRSLMAGELLVMVANKPSIGSRMKFEQKAADLVGLIAWMFIVIAIGVIVDSVFFSALERSIQRRRGLERIGG